MPKPEQIADEGLREQVQKAFAEMRAGKGTEAVKTLSVAYVDLLNLKPELMEQTIEPRPGRKMFAVMRWPALGANLKLDSIQAKKPEIEFIRDKFAVSEAITYYEYTLESAINAGA
jgi:hypothetical protein